VNEIKDYENCDGLCKVVDKIIYIKENNDSDYFNSVLLHEIGHAVFWESSIGQTSVSHDLEEIIVDQIAKALVKNFNIQPKGDIVCQKNKKKSLTKKIKQ